MLAYMIRIHDIKLKYSEIALPMSPELTGNAVRCRIKGLRKAGRDGDGAAGCGVGGDTNVNSSFLPEAGEDGSDLNGNSNSDKDEGEWHGFDQHTTPAVSAAPSSPQKPKQTGMKVNKSSLPRPRNKKDSKGKKAVVLKKVGGGGVRKSKVKSPINNKKRKSALDILEEEHAAYVPPALKKIKLEVENKDSSEYETGEETESEISVGENEMGVMAMIEKRMLMEDPIEDEDEDEDENGVMGWRGE
jgi:hypothetical protein